MQRTIHRLMKTGGCFALVCGSIAHAQQFLVPPAFKENTAPGWTVLDDARLTAAPAGGDATGIDPVGDGWLRLTENTQEQAGSVFLNTPFSADNGWTIEFEYATYNTSSGGADGFTLYIADGSVQNPNTGTNGGALGYAGATATPVRGPLPGVFGGYVGIGFDEWGNFSAQTTAPCDELRFSCGQARQSIVVRGRDTSKDDPNATDYTGLSGYEMLYQIPNMAQNVETGSRAGARKVRVTLEPAPSHTFELEVDFNDGQGYVQVIPPFDIDEANGAIPPETFRIGFSAATGSVTNFHEIRMLGVYGARSTTTTLTPRAAPACGATRLQAKVTVSDPANHPPVGYMLFMNGEQELGRSLVDAQGNASITANLPEGSYAIVSRYEGDEVYGVSESQPQTITSLGDCAAPVSVPSLQEWGVALTTGFLAVLGVVMLRQKKWKQSGAGRWLGR